MKFKLNNLLISLFAFLLCIFFAGENKLHAQGRGVLYTVNDTGDTVDASPGDGICADAGNKCTLRAAIGESNTTIERDAIVFILPQPSTINLTLGELVISRSLHIAGPGARRLTIQRSTQGGTPNFRVFSFSPGQNVSNIRGVSIRNGHDSSGGGILIGALHLVDVVDCSLIGNHATGDGGAIKADGSRLVLLRVLIASNVAETNGGGVHLMANTLDANITNSTFTANSAATGGAINNGGPLVLINNTISQNTATTSSSIHSNSGGSITVLNTIIGRDIGQIGTALSGQFISAGNNIVTDARNSTGFVHDVNADQVSDNNVIDPLLTALADNGGQTDTLGLLANSPAINKANPCVINGNCPQLPGMFIRGRTDQRKTPRNNFGSLPEIGAYEDAQLIGTFFGTLQFGFFDPPVTRFTNALAILTNTRTLEKKITRINILGRVTFTRVQADDDHILEIKSKRAGPITPILFPSD
ncbi:MAG: choice-of-anchor Q domain-containing protein [Pyrinomonadaceae bacterium]